jgi:FkbM family methyltransferase
MVLELDVLVRIYGLRPTGVLHLGAHEGEEAKYYERAGIDRVVWLEGNPELVDSLRERVEPRGHRVFQALVSDREDEPVQFHVTNNFQSSSILELGTHLQHHPEVHVTHTLELTTTTVDALAREHDFSGLNFMNLDIQGAEMKALRGASETLRHVDYVYTEVNREAVYKDCPHISEIDSFLGGYGMERIVTKWSPAGWGDALYVRGGVSPLRKLRGLAYSNLGELKVRLREEYEFRRGQIRGTSA